MSAVIDTNVLIFDTFEDSESHAEAVTVLDSLVEWIIPGIVVHEYVWFMKDQGIAVEETRQIVEDYLTDAKTRFRPDDADDVSFSLQHSAKLSDYNDMLLVSSARRLGCPLLTFDRRLSARARKLGVEPVDPYGK